MFLNRLLLFIMALCLGSLLVRMHLPIPFLLGGLLTALLCKTLTHRSDVSWPKQWREYALMVAGYGIGSTFTADTYCLGLCYGKAGAGKPQKLHYGYASRRHDADDVALRGRQGGQS